MKRPGVVLSLAVITGLLILASFLIILFSVNPTASDNQREIRNSQAEIKKTVMSQHAIICAQVQNTANSYRFRSLTPSGNVEPIRHFLTRMQAQQQTLRLARGSECKSAPGFPPVGLQVRRALRQIHEILQHFEPKLREPVSRGISHKSAESPHKQGGFLPSVVRPPHAGIDESGVPHQLKPELAPSAPTGPQTGHSHTAPPTEAPQAESPPPEEPPTPAGTPGTNVVTEPKRPPLPTTPVKVEVKPPEVTIEGIP